MRIAMKLVLVATCISASGALALRGQQVPKVLVVFRELQSEQTSDQAAATLLKLGKTDPKVRQYLATHLPAMIQSASTEPWMNAVRLAGQLKITEAVPALTKWITLDNITTGAGTIAETMRLDSNPAGKALAEIGDPSVPTLSRILNGGNFRERHDAIFVLYNIGSAQAKRALAMHMKNEPDAMLREFIQQILHTWDSDHAPHRPKPTRG